MLLFLHIHVLIFLITFASYIMDKERTLRELRIPYLITIHCEVTVFFCDWRSFVNWEWQGPKNCQCQCWCLLIRAWREVFSFRHCFPQYCNKWHGCWWLFYVCCLLSQSCQPWLLWGNDFRKCNRQAVPLIELFPLPGSPRYSKRASRHMFHQPLRRQRWKFEVSQCMLSQVRRITRPCSSSDEQENSHKEESEDWEFRK